MRNLAIAVGAAMCLPLAACGGGSSNGVGNLPPPAPAPTPSPAPPPTNTTLTNLVASQSFVNDAASTAVTFDLTTGTAISGSARRNSLTVSYDAANASYTLTVEGRTDTFGASAGLADTQFEKVYTKIADGRRDYLTLVKVPYTGSLETRYVGLGYWQRNILEPGRQTTDYVAFTYGLPTPIAAVPRTGLAGFYVDAFGLVTAPGEEPRSFEGRGELTVDFTTGIFSTLTSVTEIDLVSGGETYGGLIELTAAGHLAADGSFSGNALYSGGLGRAGGTLGGRFYGPNSEELGATFAASNAAGMAVAGSFTGQRNAGIQPQNLALTNMTREHVFRTSSRSLTWQNAETFLYGTPSSDQLGGQFTVNDKVAGGDPNFTTWRKTFTGQFGSQDVTLQLYRPGSANTELALTYASFGTWSAVDPDTMARIGPDHFVYGFETPARLLTGRTGTGQYRGVVYGSGFGNTERYAVKGTSEFTVDFTAQSLSGALAMSGTSTTGGAPVDFGRFDFSGQLPSFVADTEVTLVRGGLNLGSMETRFYGPDGEEIAGNFYILTPQGTTPGSNIAISGIAVAKRP